MKMKLYKTLRVVLGPVMRLLFPISVSGAENLPEEGAAILCANHTCLLDPVMLGIIYRRPVHFMAKEELFKNKILNAFFRTMGAFPVNRGGNDMGAVRESMKILKEGEILGIFPQGTRAKNGVQPPMLPGCALIAIRSAAPVYPVLIEKQFRLFRRTKIFFGPAVDMTGVEKRVDNAALQNVTGRIENAVWSLGK